MKLFEKKRAPTVAPAERPTVLDVTGSSPLPVTTFAGRREVEAQINVEPMPFQVASLGYAVSRDRVLIADDMGLGKTLQSIMVALLKDEWPCIVVAPGGLVRQWAREIMLKVKRPGHVEIISSGRIPTLTDGRAWYIVSYELLPNLVPLSQKVLARQAERTRKRREKSFDLKALVKPRSLIFDECHYAKSYKAQRAKACQSLASRVPVRIALSGTPAVHGPGDLIQQLTVLGVLDAFGGFWNYILRFCGAKKTPFGWDTTGATNLEELNRLLREVCMVRRKKREVLKDLPPRRVSELWVEIPRDRQLDALREWASSADGEEILGTSDGRAAALQRVNTLRRTAGEAKIDIAVEWAQNFLLGGEKLVVFTWHREVATQIASRLGGSLILGGMTPKQRDDEISRFVSQKERRVIVLTYGAGGTGVDRLQTVASDMLMVETGWTPKDHDQAEGRIERIGATRAMTFWYLLGLDSIDVETWATIEEKREVVSAVTDGGAPDYRKEDTLAGILGRLSGKAPRQVVGQLTESRPKTGSRAPIDPLL